MPIELDFNGEKMVLDTLTPEEEKELLEYIDENSKRLGITQDEVVMRMLSMAVDQDALNIRNHKK